MTAVRLAVPEDESKIIDLCKMLHEENGLFPLSMPKVKGMIDRAFNREGAIIGVIGEIGEPVASIYLDINQVVYSEAFSLTEQWNFVHPDFRRSDCAKRLLAYAKHCSDELQIPLTIGILSNQRTEAKIRLYERQLDRAGAYFIYNRKFSGSPAWDDKG